MTTLRELHELRIRGQTIQTGDSCARLLVHHFRSSVGRDETPPVRAVKARYRLRHYPGPRKVPYTDCSINGTRCDEAAIGTKTRATHPIEMAQNAYRIPRLVGLGGPKPHRMIHGRR